MIVYVFSLLFLLFKKKYIFCFILYINIYLLACNHYKSQFFKIIVIFSIFKFSTEPFCWRFKENKNKSRKLNHIFVTFYRVEIPTELYTFFPTLNICRSELSFGVFIIYFLLTNKQKYRFQEVELKQKKIVRIIWNLILEKLYFFLYFCEYYFWSANFIWSFF